MRSRHFLRPNSHRNSGSLVGILRFGRWTVVRKWPLLSPFVPTRSAVLLVPPFVNNPNLPELNWQSMPPSLDKEGRPDARREDRRRPGGRVRHVGAVSLLPRLWVLRPRRPPPHPPSMSRPTNVSLAPSEWGIPNFPRRWFQRHSGGRGGDHLTPHGEGSGMAGISNLRACPVAEFGPGLRPARRASLGPREVRVSRVPEAHAFQIGRLFSSQPRKAVSPGNRNHCINMALIDERSSPSIDIAIPAGVLAYDLVQGALVRWNSLMDKSIPDPPTAVLLHGILGCRKNWGSFARRLAQEFPTWQFLLVDLRCHGDSASLKKHGRHTVASAALDVLKLVRQLRVTPRVLVGHSFGGKVALSMVEQVAKPLARPVKVWVLDATPGKVRPGGHGEDRPGELIAFLSRVPKEVSSKQQVVEALVREGFSSDVAQWVATNLRRTGHPSSSPGFSWVFDLNGIADMYRSYEETNLWKVVEDVPRGVHINFLKAERSLHRWALEDIQRIHAAEELAADEGAGVQMHVLEDAGHWVHADNPDGLFKILSRSFC
uniref:Putative esterase/lipase HI_0193 n=1 Tax=Anthurium amnicola TaxID=1678845 RepID=A0A1D1XFC7_9ARAE